MLMAQLTCSGFSVDIFKSTCESNPGVAIVHHCKERFFRVYFLLSEWKLMIKFKVISLVLDSFSNLLFHRSIEKLYIQVIRLYEIWQKIHINEPSHEKKVNMIFDVIMNQTLIKITSFLRDTSILTSFFNDMITLPHYYPPIPR